MNNKIEINQLKKELSLSPVALKQLGDKHFSDEIIDLFDIGFRPVCSSYDFDLLNGRIIVPIYDVYGNHIAYSGRKVDGCSTDVKEYYKEKTSDLVGLNKFLKWKTSKWINTPYQKSKHLYNLNNAKKYIFESGFCIIVEGYYDVMRLYEYGIKNAVALCGTSLSDFQCELIFRYCNRILVMLDGDDAGRVATNKTVLRARARNIFANIVELPDKCDPDDVDKETMEIIFDEILNAQEEVYIKL